MHLPKIENLEISQVTSDVLLIHQVKPPFFFSCCDGLLILPKEGRNKNTIVVDLNIEKYLIKSIIEEYGPVSDYLCSHGHLDHTCHVHAWEELGASIHAPIPESKFLLDLKNFYSGFGFDEKLDYHTVREFAKLNGYKKCKQVKGFTPGISLEFDAFKIRTISFKGHSKAHIGFLLPKERVLHISCLGFDKPNPEKEGFGPWYGFRETSITQYLDDINKAEKIFLEKTNFLTSSHSYIVKNPDLSPFEYMRKKIKNNQEKVDRALKESNRIQTSENDALSMLLEMDLFFPKGRLEGVVYEIYRFWESWIIRKHIQQNRFFKAM
ncbi:MAG: MBL fold metallo-hydrolase [Promethearchaeota archaeon]|jgi:glyoxylase-like metal-dependent hydrolase (beta-lactamase superfamily II)